MLETLQFAHTCQQGTTAELFNVVSAIEEEAAKMGVDCRSFRGVGHSMLEWQLVAPC